MIYITRRPEKTIYGSETSRWGALFNPYLFEVTRKDYNVTSTAIRPAYHATLPTVETDANPAELPTFLSAGQNIYLSSGIYEGVYVVQSVTGKYITIDTTYIGVGGSGYVNLVDFLLNFKMYFNIYSAAGTFIDDLTCKPNTAGLVLLDVSGALQKLCNNSDTAAMAVVENQVAEDMSGDFYLGYGFSYKVGDLTITTTEQVDGSIYYWTASAQQITGKQFSYGQNMAEYVPFNVSGSEAKFLSAFTQPRMWAGFPFTLSFIYGEDFASEYLQRGQQNKNINGANTSSETDVTLGPNGIGRINYLLLDDLDPTTAFVDVWLQTGGAIPDGGGYYEPGYMEGDYVDMEALPMSSGS